jgi:hypothetical protein
MESPPFQAVGRPGHPQTPCRLVKYVKIPEKMPVYFVLYTEDRHFERDENLYFVIGIP